MTGWYVTRSGDKTRGAHPEYHGALMHSLRFSIARHSLAWILLCVRIAIVSVLASAAGATTLSLTDFGAVGDGVANDLPAFRAAVEKAVSLPPPVLLQFGPGRVYRFEAESGRPMSVPVMFARGLTIDGGGSTVVMHPALRLVSFYRCQDVVLQNLTIDYSPLPFTQGAVIGIDVAQAFVDFEAQEGYPLPYVAGPERYADSARSDVNGFRASTRTHIHQHSRLKRVEQLGPRRYRCWFRDPKLASLLTVGDFLAVKVVPQDPEFLRRGDDPSIPLRERGDVIAGAMSTIRASQCSGVTLRGITSYAAPGMTVNMSGCDGVHIDGFVIRRKPGTDRLIAGQSDGIHLKTNGRAPRIENCSFEGTTDDSIHVKTSGDIVTEAPAAVGARFRIRHMDVPPDNTNLEPGRSVTIFRPSDRRVLGVAAVKAFEVINRREGWVTLDTAVEGISRGTILFLTSEGKVVIRNCDFGSQLQRAILVRARALVESCRFNDVPGIVVAIYPSGAIEGPLPEAFEFINNVVHTCDPRSLLRVAAPTSGYQQHGTFVVRGNTFYVHRDAAVVDFKNAAEVLVTGNTIRTDGGDGSSETRIRVQEASSSRVGENVIDTGGWGSTPPGIIRCP